MEVSFSAAERSELKRLAAERHRNARRNGTPDGDWLNSGMSKKLEIDYMGLLGEAAVARVLGVPFRPVTKHTDKQAGDLTVEGIGSIEVKFSKFYRGDFALRSNDLSNFRADIGVLVHSGRPPSNPLARGWTTYAWDSPVIVAGWVRRETFALLCRYKDYGYGERAILPCSMLTPINLLTTVPGGHYGL